MEGDTENLPKLKPCTVRLTDEDAGPLPRATALRYDASIVMVPDIDATRAPTDIASRRLPPIEALIRLCKVVSDSHDVMALPVRPTDSLSVYGDDPMPLPKTVITLSWLAARFITSMMLSDDASLVKAAVELPTAAPAVIATRRLANAPWLIRHTTHVSDTHTTPWC